ncbi:hypothetical protein [Catenulispora sp. GAS73]|uniref:hypothetical protein n=1 Tax=Catenulispora sp. GAS73 TaxID=3156269 RepID=UPI003516092C
MACYFPEWTAAVITFVNGEPVCSVQIAHIRGANPNSERYDPAMTDDERRAFSNLILLCTPHHTVIDRLHPEDYSAELLQEWKTRRETEAGIDNGAVSSLTEERLIELIENAVDSAGPERLVTVELGLGIAMRGQLLSFPVASAKDHLPAYTDHGPPVLLLTVRNTGGLRSFVNSHRLRLGPSGIAFTMNDFPWVNPALPCALDVGESQTWIYDREKLTALVKTTRATLPTEDTTALVGEADLGSGESVRSDELPCEYLGDDL